MIDFRPEPQTILIVTAPTVSGRPPRRAAWRAGFWPSPAWRTQPMKTSSTSAGAISARRTASRTTRAPRAGEGKLLRPPRNLPMGVRTAEAMKTSLTESFSALGEVQSRDAPLLHELFRGTPVEGERAVDPESPLGPNEPSPTNHRDRRSPRLLRRSRRAPGPPGRDLRRPGRVRGGRRRSRTQAARLRRARHAP